LINNFVSLPTILFDYSQKIYEENLYCGTILCKCKYFFNLFDYTPSFLQSQYLIVILFIFIFVFLFCCFLFIVLLFFVILLYFILQKKKKKFINNISLTSKLLENGNFLKKLKNKGKKINF
jgi:hypothetical protein